MAVGRWQVIALLTLCAQSQQQPEVQTQMEQASQLALRGANKTKIDSPPEMASTKERLLDNITAQYLDENNLEVPDAIQHNHMVRMEKLLPDNETLSAMDNLPVEYEPENTTAQNQDEEDLEAADENEISARAQKPWSRPWWSKWYGYKYKGIRNHHIICPAGGYLKSMQMVFGTTPFNTGVIRVEGSTCSNGKKFGAEGGKTPGITATFSSEGGFERVIIFSGYSIRGVCLGGTCAGTSGNVFQVKCRKGRVLAGYRTSTSKRLNAIKFFCRVK
jgi:hypothetical protein